MNMKKQYYTYILITLIIIMAYMINCAEMMNNVILFISLSSSMQFLTNIFIMIDSSSLVFMVTVMMISLLVMIYASDYMINDKMFNKFMITMVIFIMSMMMMVMSSSLLWVMIGWDGLGLSSFCLIMFFNNWTSVNSAMTTFMSNRLGDMFLISSIWMSITSMSDISWSYVTEFSYPVYIMICVAAFSKSAQIPFSCWLPLAMAAPTPVSSLVHSSTLITAGVFILIRFNNLIQPNLIILLVSSLTLMMASLSALWEYDLKKIIALSTLSHVSLMMMYIYCGNKEGALMHLVMHACFKSTLFMSAGTLIHFNNNNQDIRAIFIPIKYSKTWTMFLVCNLSMMGIPFMSGFYSKEMMIMSIPDLTNKWTIYFISLMSIMLTVMYSTRMIYYVSKVKSTNIMLMEEKHDNNTIYAMTVGTMASIIMGSLMYWSMSYKEYALHMSMIATMIKYLVLLMMLCGLYLCALIFKLKIKDYSFTKLMANMMYLNSLTMVSQNFLFYMSFTLFKTMDMKGWLDVTINKCSEAIKEYNYKMNNYSLHNHFIKLIFLFIMMLIMESLL